MLESRRGFLIGAGSMLTTAFVSDARSLTQAKNHISLTTIMPKLPAEAQAWISGLNPSFRTSVEIILNYVGEDSFIKHWRMHREDQQKFENDFG
jgi:hypothetical protein